MNDELPIVNDTPATAPVPSRLARALKTPQGKGAAVLVVLVVLFGIATQQVYSRPVDDTLVRILSRVLPYPALSVNGTTVTLNEFLSEYDALKQYFAGQEGASPTDDELEVAIADTLVNKVVIRQLAQARGLEVDSERVEQYYQEVLAAQESEEAFVEDLRETFGWSAKEFQSRIVESIVLALQMSEAILSDEALQGPRRDMIDAAFARVAGGEDFVSVAREVHAGFGAGLESDLGYVKLSAIPSSWSSQVEALAVGGMTDVLDLPEGYAVFKAEDRIVAADEVQIRLLSITVPKVTLEEAVGDYLETSKVKRYVGEI
ncbi:SurA N-terminal domain-containing protein [Candidatus Uhrbacteria bacterium]|nr:SurA N-terminal domain-containing protein [Candidatus Uhrbacteria bacterium]